MKYSTSFNCEQISNEAGSEIFPSLPETFPAITVPTNNNGELDALSHISNHSTHSSLDLAECSGFPSILLPSDNQLTRQRSGSIAGNGDGTEHSFTLAPQTAFDSAYYPHNDVADLSTSSSSSASPSESASSPCSSQSSHRATTRKYNKLAAQKYRKRRNEKYTNLQSQATELREANETLRGQLNDIQLRYDTLLQVLQSIAGTTMEGHVPALLEDDLKKVNANEFGSLELG
eukprot:Nk52_evm21s225 gene=Nk52_evmTU21s225